jgi:hypothetical protein
MFAPFFMLRTTWNVRALPRTPKLLQYLVRVIVNTHYFLRASDRIAGSLSVKELKVECWCEGVFDCTCSCDVTQMEILFPKLSYASLLVKTNFPKDVFVFDSLQNASFLLQNLDSFLVPRSLKSLTLGMTGFFNPTKFPTIPSCLRYFRLCHATNNVLGTIVFNKQCFPDGLTTCLLKYSKMQFEDGFQFPDSIRVLAMRKTATSQLPSSLTTLQLGDICNMDDASYQHLVHFGGRILAHVSLSRLFDVNKLNSLALCYLPNCDEAVVAFPHVQSFKLRSCVSSKNQLEWMSRTFPCLESLNIWMTGENLLLNSYFPHLSNLNVSGYISNLYLDRFTTLKTIEVRNSTLMSVPQNLRHLTMIRNVQQAAVISHSNITHITWYPENKVTNQELRAMLLLLPQSTQALTLAVFRPRCFVQRELFKRGFNDIALYLT